MKGRECKRGTVPEGESIKKRKTERGEVRKKMRKREVRHTEGNKGLSLRISVFFKYLLYALKCEVYSCRHVLYLYIHRNKKQFV